MDIPSSTSFVFWATGIAIRSQVPRAQKFKVWALNRSVDSRLGCPGASKMLAQQNLGWI